MLTSTHSRIRLLASLLAVALLAVVAPRAAAQESPASLLADLAATPNAAAGREPTWLTALGDQLFFSGRGELTGRELWTSDGTPEGTRMVADVCPGSCSGVASAIVALGDAVYFEGCDSVPACRLWRSDGTAEGTVPVSRHSRSGSGIRQLIEWNGALFFEACDAAHGCEPYRSDGTTAGTVLLADTTPGPADAGIQQLTVAAGRLFWTAGGFQQVWSSDGTPSGTRLLRQFVNTVVRSPGIAGTDTHAFFVVGFSDLWTSDGTVFGTRLLADLGHGVDLLAAVSGELYFSSLNGRGGRGLWTSDGTAAGTRLVRDGLASSRPFPSLAFRGQLYFGVRSQLWRSDGSAAGTVLVADLGDQIVAADTDGETLYVGTRSGLWTVGASGATLATDAYAPRWVTPFRGGVAFAATSETGGGELAFSPGVGATLLTDLVDPGSSDPMGLTAQRDTLLFTSFEEPFEVYQGREAAPPVRRLGSFADRPVNASAGGRAFVLENDLWTVEAGGGLTRLFEGGPLFEGPRNLLRETAVAFEGRLAFLVWNFATDHIELWTSDGTVDGTRRLDELMEFFYCSICDPPLPFPRWGAVAAGDRLYAHFAGRLFVTDGTAGHAVELALDATCSDCNLGPAAAVGARLFFTTSLFGEPSRLWVSDGTGAGTFVVRELQGGSPDLLPVRVGDFVGLGARLFFVVEDPRLGEELWVSDGTILGTTVVSDLVPGAGSSNPRDLTALRGRLYFSADDGVHGRELWTSDGSAAGTRLVADLEPGAAGSQPDEIAAIDGRLYFSADDGVHGRELWTSDDSARGTRMLQDLQPGPLPSSPSSFTAAGSRVYFSAGTAAAGFELWAMPRASCDSCLLDGRFEVSVEWLHGGAQGVGHPLALPDAALADTTVAFWFFSPDNVELFVKMLDGRGQNGYFWVFYGALTDVEYRIRVEDRVTGEVRTYDNTPGQICGQGDTRGFLGDGVTFPAGSPVKGSGACTPGPQTLCLLDGRFRVEVDWTNQHAGGVTGTGQAVPLTDETGYFWFFSRNNLELAVKVLDGRAINGKFWVFYGALTDVEYDVRITDTETGAQRAYHNPPGEICGRGDTAALEP